MSDDYTVQQAANEYLEWFQLHRKSLDRTQYLINAHIIPTLGHIKVSELTTREIRKWQDSLVITPKRKRTRIGLEQEFFALNSDEAALRKRKVTANRILNTLKAILNRVYDNGLVADNSAWKRVKPFRNVAKARTEYLEVDEIKALLKVAEPSLKLLICGALYTGCRYGELARMQRCDLYPDIMKLYVQPSKNGLDRYVTLTEESTQFFKEMVQGKRSEDLIFIRHTGLPWGRSHQQRLLKKAIREADINKDISFHTLCHTHASQLAMQGVPMHVIAKQLGHSDTRMAEKHYAHLSTDYVTDTIRANFPDLGIKNSQK